MYSTRKRKRTTSSFVANKRARTRTRSSTRSSRRSRTTSSEDSLNKVSVLFTYKEGPDVFRDFIVYPVSFITPNTAFFKSSGRSNDQFHGLMRNTYVPTMGIAIYGTPIADIYNKGESTNTNTNIITKTEKFIQSYLSLVDKKSETYINFAKNNNIKPYQSPELLTGFMVMNWRNGLVRAKMSKKPSIYKSSDNILITDIDIKKYEELYPNADEETLNKVKKIDILSILPYYFVSYELLEVSARIGGGVWDLYPLLRNFILNYKLKLTNSRNPVLDMFEPRNQPLEHIRVVRRNPPIIDNDNEVNEILRRHNAYSDIMNNPSEETALEIYKNFYQNNYNFLV